MLIEFEADRGIEENGMQDDDHLVSG